MSITSREPIAAAPAAPSGIFSRIGTLPSWARWALYAAIGIFLLSFVEALEAGGGSMRLTSDSAASAMLRWSVPILLAGLAGLYSERAGVVNIGLEGMMIMGTWFGAWGALEFGVWGGLLAALIGGAIGGLLHAVATVSFHVDHIISGVAINLIAPGVTKFLSSEVWGNSTQSPDISDLGSFTMPLLAGAGDTPDLLGNIDDRDWFFISDMAGFFRGLIADVSYFTLIALALVPLTMWLLWRTRFGLRLRIAGEAPVAGETLGVNIYKQKYMGVIISGGLSGLAGGFIAMELSGFYQEGQTQGRGFIGLAALVFGNYRPVGILAAAFLFGYPFGISLLDLDDTSTHAIMLLTSICLAAVAVWAALQKKRPDFILAVVMSASMLAWYLGSDEAPSWLPNTMPFALVLLVLIFASQRLRVPAADGVPYRRGGT